MKSGAGSCKILSFNGFWIIGRSRDEGNESPARELRGAPAR
jgi:hypothetical protein